MTPPPHQPGKIRDENFTEAKFTDVTSAPIFIALIFGIEVITYVPRQIINGVRLVVSAVTQKRDKID